MNISSMFETAPAGPVVSNSSMILLDWKSQSVGITEEAQKLKKRALAASAQVLEVTDAQTQSEAVKSQQQLSGLVSLVEKARKATKEPALELGRRIDEAAKVFVQEAKAEELRLATLVGDFQSLELAKARAAERVRQLETNQIEAQRQRDLAQAKTHDDLDRINEEANNAQAAIAEQPKYEPTRATGQRVSEDWEITVVDIWLLAKSHPTCVKIEPLVSEIKGLIKAGVKVAGVIAKPIIKAGVIKSRPVQAIDV